jgi:hypothetical protein
VIVHSDPGRLPAGLLGIATVMVVTLRRVPRRRRAWPRIGGTGALLWLACLLVIGVTGNAALVPSLILLGSFLVPVTFVAWAFERWRDEDVTTELIVVAFVVGGLLGTLGAAVLEAYLLHPSALLFLGVGLIEEAAKLVALLAVTRRMTRRHTRDGAVLGAAVGFGFAAFESAGYAFQVLISPGGSLAAMVSTELLRGVLAPFGHGLWTAILGAAAFHRLARLRSTRTAAAQAASNGGGVRRPRWTDGLGGGGWWPTCGWPFCTPSGTRCATWPRRPCCCSPRLRGSAGCSRTATCRRCHRPRIGCCWAPRSAAWCWSHSSVWAPWR